MSTQAKTKRILIMDDDPNIVQMLSDTLRDEGYEVVTATQSLRAFDRVKESQPDLILLDIMMPYLDGWDQITLLRLDDDLKDIPIIVITASRSIAVELQGFPLRNIWDVLHKPFHISDLLEKIAEVLSHSGGYQERDERMLEEQHALRVSGVVFTQLQISRMAQDFRTLGDVKGRLKGGLGLSHDTQTGEWLLRSGTENYFYTPGVDTEYSLLAKEKIRAMGEDI